MDDMLPMLREIDSRSTDQLVELNKSIDADFITLFRVIHLMILRMAINDQDKLTSRMPDGQMTDDMLNGLIDHMSQEIESLYSDS